MAHVYHHAQSSVRRFGGKVEDYLPIHQWFDATKAQMADNRHRALRHHAEGIFQCEEKFGVTLRNSDGQQVPVRILGEQHVQEDLGLIPSVVDWLREIKPQPWMGPKSRIQVTVEEIVIKPAKRSSKSKPRKKVARKK